jgi:hypothetical protein
MKLGNEVVLFAPMQSCCVVLSASEKMVPSVLKDSFRFTCSVDDAF